MTERLYRNGRTVAQLVSCHTYKARGKLNDQTMFYTLRKRHGTVEATSAQFLANWKPIDAPRRPLNAERYTSTRGQRRRAQLGRE